jgi:hypothetical protein
MRVGIGAEPSLTLAVPKVPPRKSHLLGQGTPPVAGQLDVGRMRGQVHGAVWARWEVPLRGDPTRAGWVARDDMRRLCCGDVSLPSGGVPRREDAVKARYTLGSPGCTSGASLADAL